MPDEHGSLSIAAERGGSTEEIRKFLADLENAYVAVYGAGLSSICDGRPFGPATHRGRVVVKFE